MNELIKTGKNMCFAAWESAAFCFQHAPLRYASQIVVELILGIIPFVVLYIWKELINLLSVNGFTQEAWYFLATYIIVIIFQLAVETMNQHTERLFRERVDMKCQSIIFDKLSTLDVGKYDDPQFQDAMKVVGETPAYPQVFEGVLEFVKNVIITICAVAGVSGRYPLAAAVLVLLYIPTLCINARNSVKDYEQYRSEERDQRRSNYYRNVLTGQETASELRLYGYEDIFREKYNSIWKKLYRSHIHLKKIQTAWEVLGQIINMLGLIVVILFVYTDIRLGTCPAGDAALLIGLVLTMMDSVESTCISFSDFYMNYLNCNGKLKAFLALKSSLEESGTRTVEGIPSIEFRNVSFRYPGKKEYVLKNISFKLESGEKLALVGVNGAGKTTITKLLCRFYDPTKGEILINGINAKEYDIHKLRRMYGVLFQANRIYKMSIRENIELSDTRKRDELRFREACLWSGMETFIDKCVNGYETGIGRNFHEDNYEPSGGEAQKIGLARAYYKDSVAMILDEPSSALDAEAEEYVFRQFMEISAGKTAFLISHRLSAVSMADKIALVEDGRLQEFGSHEDLLKKGGRYAKLYKLQADAYREVKDNA